LEVVTGALLNISLTVMCAHWHRNMFAVSSTLFCRNLGTDVMLKMRCTNWMGRNYAETGTVDFFGLVIIHCLTNKLL